MKRLVPLIALLSSAVLFWAPLPARAATTVGLWHMDETSGGTANDSSDKDNDGRLSHITFVTPGFDGSGGAYSFNGTSSKVIVSSSSSLSPGSQTIIVTVHVNFTDNPSESVGDYDLVRKGSSSAPYYKVEILQSGKAFCFFRGSSSRKGVTVGPALNDGHWHTITCKKTSGTISGTVDGTTSSKSITIGSISNSASLVFGGKASGNDDLYKGEMDEVVIAIG